MDNLCPSLVPVRQERKRGREEERKRGREEERKKGRKEEERGEWRDGRKIER